MKEIDIRFGDHIRVFRGFYWHHGISIGSGLVVHYGARGKHKLAAKVERVTLDEFCQGKQPEVVQYKHCNSPEEVVSFAISKIGERKYNLVFYNCEHFASQCKTGDSKSEQVEYVVIGAALIARRPKVALGIGIAFGVISLFAILAEQQQSQPALA